MNRQLELQTTLPSPATEPQNGDRLGLLWLADEDVMASLSEAVKRFKEKFGRSPVLIEVPKAALDKEYRLNGLIVKPCQTCPGRLIKLW